MACANSARSRGVHLQHVHVAHGDGTDVLQIDAQQGATEDVAVAALLHQELDGGDDLLTLLHLIQENKRLAGDQFFLCQGGQAEQESIAVLRPLEQGTGLLVFNEVDADKGRKRLPPQGLDDVGLAHLPGPGDEQGFFFLGVEKTPEFGFDVSDDHGLFPLLKGSIA